MVTSHIQVQQPEIEKKHNRWRLDSTSWCHLATDEQRRFMFIWGSQRRAGTIARVPLKDYFRLGNVCQGRGASRLSRTVNWAPFFPPSSPPLSSPQPPNRVCYCWRWVFFAMDVLWMVPLLLFPLLMWTSSTFVFYFKKCFYVGWMMCLALIAIPLCILKSGGRDVENMRWVFCLHNKCRSSDS